MVFTRHARAIVIQKLNNIVYSPLNNYRPNVISDKWKQKTMQDWEFLAKNFNDVSNELITDADLSKLDIHISVPGYLKEGKPYFVGVIEDENKESDQDAKEKPMVSDSKEENIKKKGSIQKKRDA